MLLSFFVIVPFRVTANITITVPELWFPFGDLWLSLRLLWPCPILFHFTALIQRLLDFAFSFFLLFSCPLLLTSLEFPLQVPLLEEVGQQVSEAPPLADLPDRHLSPPIMLAWLTATVRKAALEIPG
jgi:hypothetical protein